MITLTFLAFFTNSTQEFNLPPNLLSAICFIESRHTPSAVHKDDGNSDSLGICQIKLSTAHFLGFKGTKRQLMDPKINIHYAAKYLKYQLTRYNDIPKAVTAYNMGSAKGFKRSRYSDRVLSYWRLKNAFNDYVN